MKRRQFIEASLVLSAATVVGGSEGVCGAVKDEKLEWIDIPEVEVLDRFGPTFLGFIGGKDWFGFKEREFLEKQFVSCVLTKAGVVVGYMCLDMRKAWCVAYVAAEDSQIAGRLLAEINGEYVKALQGDPAFSRKKPLFVEFPFWKSPADSVFACEAIEYAFPETIDLEIGVTAYGWNTAVVFNASASKQDEFCKKVAIKRTVGCVVPRLLTETVSRCRQHEERFDINPVVKARIAFRECEDRRSINEIHLITKGVGGSQFAL